jgi:hypothetical protein
MRTRQIIFAAFKSFIAAIKMRLSWNINGVAFRDSGKIIDAMGTDSAAFPEGFAVSAVDTSTIVMTKISNEVSKIGRERLAGTITVGDDGRPIAQNMSDIQFICTNRTPFKANLSSVPNTIVANIFAQTDMVFQTNNLIKNTAADGEYELVADTETDQYEYAITISPTDQTGAIIGFFTIISDGDPCPTNTTIAGSLRAVRFRVNAITDLSDTSPNIVPTYLTITERSGAIERKSVPYQFYVDTIAAIRAPHLSSAAIISITPASIVYRSGVPRHTVGTIFQIQVNAKYLVSEFYNLTRLIALTSAYTATTNYMPSTEDILDMYFDADTSKQFTITTTLSALVCAQTPFTITITGYTAGDANSAATSANYGTSTLTCDTISTTISEQGARYPSGTGQYPGTSGGLFTQAGRFSYNVAASLATNEELQLLGGRYMYPRGNYTTEYTPGPDYSALPDTSYSSFRWYSQKFVMDGGAVAYGVFTSGRLTITACATNMIDSISSLRLYVKFFEGDVWRDALAEFNPADENIVNGYPCGTYAPESPTAANFMSGSNWIVPITLSEPVETSLIFVRFGMLRNTTLSFETITLTDII